MEVPQWVKPGVWGAIVGAVGMMIQGVGGPLSLGVPPLTRRWRAHASNS